MLASAASLSAGNASVTAAWPVFDSCSSALFALLLSEFSCSIDCLRHGEHSIAAGASGGVIWRSDVRSCWKHHVCHVNEQEGRSELLLRKRRTDAEPLFKQALFFFLDPRGALRPLTLACSSRTFSTRCRSCSAVSGWRCVTAPSTPTAPRTSTSTARVGRGSCAPRWSSLGSPALVSARSPARLLTLTEARAASISAKKKKNRCWRMKEHWG